MSRISIHLRNWRMIFLLLLLVALSGPWYFDRVAVPGQYACSSGIRLDEDFCGLPGSGLWIVPYAFGGLFNAARELLAASIDFTNWLRIFLFSLLPLLILLPFLSILFVIWRAENRRGQYFHLLILGVAAVSAGLFLSLPPFSRLYWALWGPWFYLCLALSMLLFESFALWESTAQGHTALDERPLLAAQAGGGVTELIGRSIPWHKIIFFVACLLPLLPAVIYLTGLSAMRRSENRRVVNQVALADFDGDGRQDALIILNRLEREHPPDRLLLNEGDGHFTASDLWPGTGYAQAVAVGDLTGNGRMDVAVAYTFGGLARVLNHDSGALVPFGVVPERLPYGSKGVVLGDLNDDGRLDAFVVGCCPGGEVWFNRGDGLLTSSQQRLGPALSQAVALADLNGDGALDAFVVHGNNWPYIIWWNGGHGRFNDGGQTIGQAGDFAIGDSGQTFGRAGGFAIALGDVNGDGFPDAVVGRDGADEIWLNEGQGNFIRGQRFGRGFTSAVFLADLDGDGDLDLVVGGRTNGRIWLNDGKGHFRRGQGFSYGRYQSFAVGDVAGDGIVDIFVAGVESYQVWRGQGNGRFMADPRASYR